MNRFLTHTGRQPIWLDDINFIQDSIADEIKKLVQGLIGFDDEIVILSGCQKAVSLDGSVSVTKGVIYYDGELLSVPATSFATDPGLRIRVISQFDPSGDRNLHDTGEEVSCYNTRRAAITGPKISGKPDTAPSLSTCRRLEDILLERTNTLIYSGEEYGKDGTTRGLVTLSRLNQIYMLSCHFNGLNPEFEIEFENSHASEELAVNYDIWSGTTSYEPAWTRGEHHGIAIVNWYTHDDMGSSVASVRVITTKASDNTKTVKLQIQIISEKLRELSKIADGYTGAQGAVTMILNNNRYAL